jgi:ATP-dependent DNA helicase RecG
LISDAKTGEARRTAENSGGDERRFRIAEADLKLRGPGELLGREQSGVPRFRFGNSALAIWWTIWI